MFTTRRSGPFIKQFSGPGENTIVCFKFWQAVIASGCPGECSYCFLQTQYPYRTGLYDLKGTLFENLPDIELEARRWLRQSVPAGLILGENQDGLAFEKPYKQLLGITPLEILIPLFHNQNPVGHTLVVLSKFTSTSYAEALGPSPNVVFSWSLSLPSISRDYEKKVSPLQARLKKASEMKRAGYRIRFRLDALAPIANWEKELDSVLESINDIQPEMLTIGALRATNPTTLRRLAQENRRDASIFDHLATVDPSGFKHRTADEFHEGIFRRVKDSLRAEVVLGLCKEDSSIWRDVNVNWNGCHCLHGKEDRVVVERIKITGRSSVPVQIKSSVRVVASP